MRESLLPKRRCGPPLPNLIETQKLAYAAFLQRNAPPNERSDIGLQAVFKEVFQTGEKSGVRDFSEVNSLEFVSYSLGEPKYTLQECVARGVTYQVSLTARIMLVTARGRLRCRRTARRGYPRIRCIPRRSAVNDGKRQFHCER